ncbi:MAG TPA: hypothetical protein VK363_11310 [Pyrinomonadaceae bacterium]|nr:hypothetical protein [Pyrinomonadaceae bacterium]
MLKKVLSLALAALLINAAGASPVFASPKAEKEARFIEKVRTGIGRLGTGTQARIEVKLRDRRKLKGYVGEAGAESFVVVDAKTGAATTVPYSQVGQVRGNNLSTDVQLAIGVGMLVALIILVVALVPDT